MDDSDPKFDRRRYRNIFIVQDRNFWDCCPFEYDRDTDLVLTFDFGLRQKIEQEGGAGQYIDHLVDGETLEAFNFKLYQFLSEWYLDGDGKDCFSYKGFRVGNAFRIAIWNDVSFRIRLILNLIAVSRLDFANIYMGADKEALVDVAAFLDLNTKKWNCRNDRYATYYFPVFQWMDEKIYPAGAKENIKRLLAFLLDNGGRIGRKLGLIKTGDKDVFVHPYHPTASIIEHLKSIAGINVVIEKYTWAKSVLRENRLPLGSPTDSYRELATDRIKAFNSQTKHQFVIDDVDIAETLYPIILRRVEKLLPFSLRAIDSICRYFSKKNLALMISITNIGLINCLMQNYCHRKNVPSMIIINGILASSFLDEAKDATWINAYGQAIKSNYFDGADHVVCLGDPRMDDYATAGGKSIARGKPTVLIGAAGFSNVDLNSYVAFEFEFLNDVMGVLTNLTERGNTMELIIKVRPNGYLGQYRRFLDEYYPGTPVQLYDKKPIKELYSVTDFYISIYSQTLFEASCLGIPVLYYKKDTQRLHEPFDGKSELVTAIDRLDLKEKIISFLEGAAIYDGFATKAVMEKYIGPLDGGNLDRNLQFIDALMTPSVT